jgi:hypothetical protein
MRSRTYLPTDWQLWVYTAPADIFRWDFSTWDGGDVWGDTDQAGSLQPLDTEIISIELIDGSRPDNSYLASVSGGVLTLSAKLPSWNANFITEMYTGKKIALTLKNEADYTSPEFGQNTVYFVGRITSCITEIVPETQEVFYTITAEDYFSQALSQLIRYQRYTTVPKHISLSYAIDESVDNGLLPEFLQISLWTASDNPNQTANSVTDTLGVLLNDYVASEVALVQPIYSNIIVGSNLTWQREVTIRPLFIVDAVETLTDENLISIEMGVDGGDRPTSFKLSNATTTVDFGANQAGFLANQNTYTNILDTDITGLNDVIEKLQQTTAKLSPITVQLQTAKTYNKINYSYTGLNSYVYPDTHYAVGDEIFIESETLGETYPVVIVAIRHNIDADNWLTTLELSKGL